MAEQVIVSGAMPSADELRRSKIKNMNKPLPMSPRVKCLANGKIFTWQDMFARRADLFVCCDEFGNENPAAWYGRGPDGRPFISVPEDAPVPVTAVQPHPTARPKDLTVGGPPLTAEVFPSRQWDQQPVWSPATVIDMPSEAASGSLPAVEESDMFPPIPALAFIEPD
jgi:hypothetical protein